MKYYLFIIAYLVLNISLFSQNKRMIDDIREHKTGTAVWWAGMNSWIIKSDGLVIATDLDLSEGSRIAPSPVTPEELATVLDVAFVTHAHGDHFNEYTHRILAKKSSCLFVLAETCLPVAKKLAIPDERIIIAKPRLPFEVKGVSVNPVRALHGRMTHTIHYEANFQDCGYLLTIGGRTFFQPGDTRLLEDHLMLKHVDVLFFSPTEHDTNIEPSVILINTLEPDYILPQHHSTFRTTETNYYWTVGYPIQVYNLLSNSLKERYHILKIGEKMEIK